MIGKLKGAIDSYGEDFVILDVHGVGYLVHCSARTLQALPATGEAVELAIETHVREDQIRLFGFLSNVEREWFRLLQTVQGVGTKVALAVLSGIEPQELIRAIDRGDVARLTAIPGVGKKTAERIVLELKDRLPRTPSAAVAAGTAAPEAPVLRDDVVSALVNLGYHRPLAEKAAEAAIKIIGSASDASFERVLKQALREVAK